MADYYCDHGFYPTYAATPTWPNGGTPSPQDGDGRSMGTAASAVATIDFNGITAAAGNTISIAGATLTCVASGAAANQFNAGTGSTLATNVASSINAATNTVSSSASAGTPQLRSLVYARVKSGANTVVEIMTRAGSPQYNYAGNSAMAIVAAGISPTVAQFTGGASGPWGYLWNATASFLPQALGIGVYGCMNINGNTAGRLLAGPSSLAASDVMWVRCNNRDYNPGTNATLAITVPMNIVFDASNAKWGDTSGKTFKIRNTGSLVNMTVTIYNPVAAAGETHNYFGATASDAVWFVNESTGTGANANLVVSNGQGISCTIWMDRVTFRDQSATSYLYFQNSFSTQKSKQWYFEKCKFAFARSDANYAILGVGGSLVGTLSMNWENCDFVWEALSMAHPGIINAHGAASDGGATFKLNNCRASATVSVSPFQRRNSSSSAYSCYATNLSGFKLPTAYSGLFSAFSTSQGAGPVENGYAMHQNIGPKKAFRLETNSFITDWLPDTGFPTLRSTLPDGTYWAYRTVWSSSANHYSGPSGIDVLTLEKRAPVADGVRTVTLEGCMEASNLALATNTHVDIIVSYTATDGTVNFERTYPPGGFLVTPTAIAASSQPWTLNSYTTYSAFKIPLTTTKSVQGGSDISVTFVIHLESPNGTSSSIFIDPEVDIV